MAGDISSPIIRTLKSLRLTIILFICLSVIFLLGLIIPQKDLLGRDMYMAWNAQKPGLVASLEFLGFTDIYTAPITILLWALFFLNLVLVMSGRIPSVWMRCVNRTVPTEINALKGKNNYDVIEDKGIADIESVLKGKGYKIFLEGNSFRAIKNRFSPLATVLFHLSFLLLLIGGVTSFYTRLTAEANVALSETFMGEYENIRRPKIGDIPRTHFTVESIEPSYYRGEYPVDLDVTLNTEEGRREIGINRPYKKGPLSFVIMNLDVAPHFVITDGKGGEVFDSYLKLEVLNGNQDVFRVKGYEFRVFFYANYLEGLKQKDRNVIQDLSKAPMTIKTRQREIVNPAFYVGVFKDGELLTTKTIALDESVEFDGLSLSFRDYVYWIKFLVVKERGLAVVYTGFVLMITALIIRLVFYRRELMGMSENGKLHIAGMSDYYPSLFADEFKRVAGQFRG